MLDIPLTLSSTVPRMHTDRPTVESGYAMLQPWSCLNKSTIPKIQLILHPLKLIRYQILINRCIFINMLNEVQVYFTLITFDDAKSTYKLPHRLLAFWVDTFQELQGIICVPIYYIHPYGRIYMVLKHKMVC